MYKITNCVSCSWMASVARAAVGTAALAAALLAGAANAQTSPGQTPAANEPSALGEIVVTAQKQSEKLQKAPLAVSAFSSQEIEQAGLAGPQQLQFNVPSLTFGNNNGYSNITLRGIGNTTTALAAEPSVATYVDGVYNGSLLTQAVPQFDLERIEVLRGPQGTLYGRNATGGVINYISKPASFTPGAFGSVSYGNYDAVQSDVGITGPLVADKLAIRLSAHFGNNDGYRYDIATGQRGDADRIGSGRGELLFTPSSALTISLRGDIAHDRNTNPSELISLKSLDGVTSESTPLGIFSLPAAALASIPGLLSPADLAKLGGGSIAKYFGLLQPGPAAPDPTRTLNFAGVGPGQVYVVDSGGGSLKFTGDLGSVAVDAITGYRHSRLQIDGGTSGFSVPEASFGSLIQTSNQVTQELNVSGKSFGNRLDWLVGAFYFHDDGRINVTNWLPATSQSTIAGLSLATPPGSPYKLSLSQPLQSNFLTYFQSVYSTVTQSGTDYFTGQPLIGGVTTPPTAFGGVDVIQTSQSVAGFGQASYHLTDRLRLTGGVRLTFDKKSDIRSLYSNLAYTFGTLGGLTPLQLGLCDKQHDSKTWSAPTGTVGIDYDVAHNVFSYAKVSRGYKAGGFNSSGCDAPFNPEFLTSYETGVKSTFAGGQVLANAAMYYYTYSNIQFTTLTNGTDTIQNAGSATAFGLELEYAIRPRAIAGLQLDGSASFEDSHYGAGLFQDPAFQAYYQIQGNELIRAPKWKSSVGLEYARDLGNSGTVSLRGEAAYTAKIFNDIYDGMAIYESDMTQPAYWVANARLNWTSVNNRYQVQLFVNNVTNTLYATNRFATNTPLSLDSVIGQFAPPRTFGARLTVKLGSETR